MSMDNLIEYIYSYSKTFKSLSQYCKDIPSVNNDGNNVDFNRAKATDSSNFKTNFQTDNNGRIYNVEIMVPLKYLRNFWGTL